MQIQKGEIIEVKVTGITKYGVFVSINKGETAGISGMSGMIHISEISSGFIKDINEILEVNQIIKAVVIGVNDNGKLALSIKQLENINNNNNIKSVHEESKKAGDNNNDNLKSFEDMINKFKRESDEKISDLKFLEQKRSGYSRRRKD
ncbi:MAG: S1 RNA-binding domain-containing protein [Oscillospiraceae bacterium]|nr:S1 RNA-binding domain-containing protein [Oscillospiraceae bacterium]